MRRERARRISEIGKSSGEAFRRKFLGQTLQVLWETQSGGDRWSGLTDNYVRVYVRSRQSLGNTLRRAHLCGLEGGGVRGELVPTDGKPEVAPPQPTKGR